MIIAEVIRRIERDKGSSYKINGREVIYPINIRVRANQKDGVLRELRRRILIAFEKQGIRPGISSSTIIMQPIDPTAPPAAPTLGG